MVQTKNMEADGIHLNEIEYEIEIPCILWCVIVF